MLLPNRQIIAIDFDGTLATTIYPEIIEPIQGVIDYIKYCNQVGDIVILWTCRSNQHLIDAIDWCKQQGINFDYVNMNVPELVELYGNDCRKIAADMYIDDKSSVPSKFI